MNSNIEVSVILTTYNEKETFLLQSLNSILEQTFEDFELIIVLEPEDCNYQLLKNYASIDNRIIIHRNKTKLGFVKSLNIAIVKSRGKYIARIDSDDFCDPDRFQNQVNYFLKHPETDVIGTDLNIVDKSNKIIAFREYKSNHKGIKKSFVFTAGIAHPSVMVKKKCFDLYGHYNENFTFSEDLELWLRFLSKGCIFHNLSLKLLNYRVSEINENRNKTHWEFNLLARKMHAFSLWNKPTGLTSIMFAFFLAKIPLTIMSLVTATKVSNFLKGKKQAL